MPSILLVGQDAGRAGLLTAMRKDLPSAKIILSDTLRESILSVAHHGIDLALVDIGRAGPQTWDDLKEASLVHPAISFAVMSASNTRECIAASLSSGMRGLVSKGQSDGEIVRAIREILSGGIYVPWSLTKWNESAAPADNMLKLTQRQQQVLRLLSLGMSNKEIARALQIAESTTRLHTTMLMRSLGVRNRTEAAFKAGKLLSATE